MTISQQIKQDGFSKDIQYFEQCGPEKARQERWPAGRLYFGKKYVMFILPVVLCSFFMNKSHGTENPEAKSINSFTFAVTADPQAFRLMAGGDPNSKSQNGAEWNRINNNLVSALNATPDVSFGIINGDMTEFGRSNSWSAVFNVYSKLKFPYYFGLGNHDYQNNYADCFDLDWLSIDGCALRSVFNMQTQFKRYSGELKNFSSDWTDERGSLAYSWDYKGVHFVQLQNHPNYKVRLNGTSGSVYYDIIPSLTWLSNDLRRARFRGVNDIILNFHEYRNDFESSSSDYARLQFQAIMLTYKPIAVFTGHNHAFFRNTHYNDRFYGNTTVYRTGASFNAKFHLVTYDDGKLTVREMDGQTGKPVVLKTYTEERQAPAAICKLPGKEGKSGDIYISTFIPKYQHWNLRQILRTGNNVDANTAGSAYMRTWNEGNPYQIWGFEKAYGDGWPEFNSWYIIRQLATGKVLDSNSAGSVYTKDAKKGNAYQQWWPIKTERGELLLVNRATNRLLDGNGSSLYTKPGYEMFNQYKAWQLSHGWNRTQPENIRYFKALSDESWKHEYPNGNSSNTHWQYLSSHSLLSASPCIGW